MERTPGGEGRRGQWSLELPAAASAHDRVLTGSFLKDHRSAEGWPSLPQGHSKASRNFCEAVAEALLSHSESVSPTTGHAFAVLA